MYNSTSGIGEDVIDGVIIFPICVMLMMFICSIGRWICISRAIETRVDSLPKYEDIEGQYPDCPECRRETECRRDLETTTPPKYEEIV